MAPSSPLQPELCRVRRSSGTPWQHQEHPFPSQLRGCGLLVLALCCSAVPMPGSALLANPAQQQPDKGSGLLPAYQVELLKQHSPQCQEQQQRQVWRQRGMKILAKSKVGAGKAGNGDHPPSSSSESSANCSPGQLLLAYTSSRSAFGTNSCSGPFILHQPQSPNDLLTAAPPPHPGSMRTGCPWQCQGRSGSGTGTMQVVTTPEHPRTSNSRRCHLSGWRKEVTAGSC